MTRLRYILLLVLLWPFPLPAQTGSLTGVALDSVGNTVAGATITACNVGAVGIPCSPVVASTTSNGQGAFSMVVPVGTYQVTVFRLGVVATSSVVVVAPSTITVANTVTYTGNVTIGPGSLTVSTTLNGTCIVSATQTLQQCINSFPSGNGEIHIPPGTFSTASTITINGNGQSGIKIIGSGNSSVIQYTGAGAISAVLDIGTSTPSTNLLNRIILRDFVVRGNANSTHAIRLQGVHTSTIQDVNGRDVTGSALQWLYGVGNVINHWMTTTNDGIGSFSPTPTGCIELGELSQPFGFSTSSVITPRCESINGTAFKGTNFLVNSITAAQFTTNVINVDVEPSVGGQVSESNIFQGLFENASASDSFILNGRENQVINSFVTIGAGVLHIKGSNNRVENSVVQGITIDSGSLNTHITQVLMSPQNLTDNGTNTQLTNNMDIGSTPVRQWVGGYGSNPGGSSTYTQIIPALTTAQGLVGGGGFDPLAHPAQGCWDFSTAAGVSTARIINNTPLTTAKPWRAWFIGVWENNQGLANMLPGLLEITSASATLAVGTVTLTFSVNGSGQFQGIADNTGTHSASFCGTVYINPSPSTPAGTSSISVKDNITAGSGATGSAFTSNNTNIDFLAQNGSAYRMGTNGGSYFLDLGNVTFRDGASNPGGQVIFTGPIGSKGTAAVLSGTGACATITTQVGGAFAGSAKCTGTTGASTLTITFASPQTNGYVCDVWDETTRANLLQQTSHTTTTCVLTATSITANDVFVFKGVGF